MESAWTISELAELAGAALAGEPVRVNGRVRETPNERLIRWYTTIGLLDPPAGRRGRTALYGPRHLLQLVAVKRRQAAGRAIAEIQAELTGATDAVLRNIARLPERITADTAAAHDASAANDGARRPGSRPRFWTERPAPPQSTEPGRAPTVVPGIRLAAGITLLLDMPHSVSADDLAAIEAAARPLLAELHRRGLSAEHRPAEDLSDGDRPEDLPHDRR
jgi:DNA-binding transcriptional MerR regulator